jgi:hypothetical protein
MKTFLCAKKQIMRKAVSALLVICLLFISSIGYNASAYDNPVSHLDRSASTWYNYNDIYAASTTGYMGAYWIGGGRSCWEFNFRIVGTGASRYDDGDPSDLVRIAAMQIEGTSNTNNLALWTSEDSKYIGSTPETSGDDENYYDIGMALADVAVELISSQGLSYAWTAFGLVSAFLSIVDSENDQDDYIWKQWNWSSDESDVGQFFWFLADVEPNQVVQISCDYMIFGPGYELLNPGNVLYNCYAPGPPSKSMTTDWNPGMMSDEEKEKYGIEEIPAENVNEKAAELNIPDEIVEEFNKSNDEVLYYAHNLPVTEVLPSHDSSSSITKGSLIDELCNQIERNELIIKAFSNIKDKSDEDRAIIKTNEEELALLKNLLEKAQSIKENDSEGIYSLWNELNDVIDAPVSQDRN